MTTGNMTWEQAALHVLEQADEPLHYTEIADRIVDQGLTKSVGATPHRTANWCLHNLLRNGSVQKTQAGIFALPEIAKRYAQADMEDASNLDKLSIGAYGLYWSRDLVDWRKRELLGISTKTKKSINVDFVDQIGIYFLHNGNEVVYVGKSHSSLYDRLKAHTSDYRKTARWNTFSWFGFKPVSEEGKLLPVPEKAAIEDVVNVVEAIFIETLIPGLNMRGGEGAQEWLEARQFFQILDER